MVLAGLADGLIFKRPNEKHGHSGDTIQPSSRLEYLVSGVNRAAGQAVRQDWRGATLLLCRLSVCACEGWMREAPASRRDASSPRCFAAVRPSEKGGYGFNFPSCMVALHQLVTWVVIRVQRRRGRSVEGASLRSDRGHQQHHIASPLEVLGFAALTNLSIVV